MNLNIAREQHKVCQDEYQNHKSKTTHSTIVEFYGYKEAVTYQFYRNWLLIDISSNNNNLIKINSINYELSKSLNLIHENPETQFYFKNNASRDLFIVCWSAFESCIDSLFNDYITDQDIKKLN